MKVLVTGGSGVVGRAVVDALLQRGHTVRLLCRHADHDARAWEGGVEGWECDVSSPDGVRGSAEGCEAVLHAAGIAAERTPDATLTAVNVDGTRNVVREAARAGVRRLVYVSSLGAEAGESAYHRSKRAAERIVREEFPGEWLVVRPGNVYGPGDQVISLLLQLVRVLPVLPMVGDEDQPFQPIRAADLGAALARAVGPEVAAGRTLLVAGTERVSTNELVDLLEEIVDRHPPRLPVPQWLARLGTRAVEALGKPLPVTTDQIIMLQEGNTISPPEENALETVFGVTPTPLAEGLALLADELPERLPDQGVGPMHRQWYRARIRGGRFDAAGLLRMFCEQFAEITPDALLEVGVEPGTPLRLEPGATVTMAIPLRGNVQVRVEQVAEQSATCVTLAGHHLFGVIRFEAREHDGCVEFGIRSYTRAATVPDLIGWTLFGRLAQRVTWKNTVEEVVRRSGGTAEGGVQVTQKTMSERDAARVEVWAEELVMRHEREEAPAAPTSAATPRTAPPPPEDTQRSPAPPR